MAKDREKRERSDIGMMSRWLPLEKPLLELEEKIAQLEQLTTAEGIDKSQEIQTLREQHQRLLHQIFAQLSPWDKVLMARHPKRPYTLDYVNLIFEDFVELHGDRRHGDDPAMVAGVARLERRSVVIVGHQKGRDTKERQFHNYGMARPEGYRKALRAMKLGEKFGIPIISFVDTPAAECRLEAEERGICESIARNMAEMSKLRVPILVAIIGEGGSGGAIGIAVGDWVMMLEHATYSVIPPEGCAAILDSFGRDANRGPEAAEALKLTADQTYRLKVIDEIIPEPLGGAHRDPEAMAERVKESLIRNLAQFSHLSPEALVERRYRKFRAMGELLEPAPEE